MWKSFCAIAVISTVCVSAQALSSTPPRSMAVASSLPIGTALGQNPLAMVTQSPRTPASTLVAQTSAALEYAGFGSSVSQTTQNGAIAKTEYSEKAGDAKVEGISVKDGVLTVDYRLSKQAGSSYAGAGVNLSALPDGKTVSVQGYSAMRLQLASSQATNLRLRISSTDPAINSAGCYPVVFIDVTKELKTYLIPLEKFAPLGYCAANGRSITQVIGSVMLVEVADEGLPASGVRQGQIQIAKVEFVK